MNVGPWDLFRGPCGHNLGPGSMDHGPWSMDHGHGHELTRKKFPPESVKKSFFEKVIFDKVFSDDSPLKMMQNCTGINSKG